MVDINLSDPTLDQCTNFSYKYAMPLVLMHVTYDEQTRIFPDGVFHHYKRYATPLNRNVAFPNIDTLYSRAWLTGLSKVPVILTIPEIKLPNGEDRYCLFPILSGFTDVVASPGLRTKDKYPYPAKYALVGPNYKGVLPDGVHRIDIPSDMAWIFGRIQTFGEEDYDNVHKIQDELKLTRIAPWSPPPALRVFDKDTPVQIVTKMDYNEFFSTFASLWIDNPPLPADAPFLPLLARLNLIPGKQWDTSSIPPDTLKAIEQGYKAAQATIITDAFPFLDLKNFWSANPAYVAMWEQSLEVLQNHNAGVPGQLQLYVARAFFAYVGIGINLMLDSLFPSSTRDASGTAFDASAAYKIVLDELPPVHGFWSVTIYDAQGYLIANPDRIYAVGSNYNTIEPNIPIVIFIQQTKPSGLTTNQFWLPSPPPTGDAVVSFQLMFRLYWPQLPAMNGTWWMPGVQKV